MRDLALQGFGTRYEGEAWATYSNLGVKISCIMNAGDITPVRWATWSLAASIRDKIVRDRSRTVCFDMTYLGIQIGTLKLFAPYRIGAKAEAIHTELAPPLTSGPASAINGTDLILSSLTKPEDDTNSNSDDLWAEVTFTTTEILREDISMSIVQTLLNLGPLNSMAPVKQPFAVIGAAITVNTAATSFKRVERSTPPFSNYGHIVRCLAGTALSHVEGE